jgi:site-specific DNA-methyltransferase (adenine-specific)
MRARRPTATSNFGVSRRENHDARAFYERFHAPDISTDEVVAAPEPVAEPFVCGDARSMTTVADASVALVVTSPPYFAGKQYEEELEREGVPASYLEYLQMLRDVFAECVRVLEPGGRIAVNVANLGRKPYRSLSADVIGILQDDLGLLLRGELIWQKGEGATGSCAWGSFRSATNPVLRDLTERVVIASKGRFDRAGNEKQRARDGLPHQSTLMADDFMALTLDVWKIPAERARAVGHPAPFPVELPEQLIRLYTFAGDLVLDPFMGSGSALVAAARLGRRYVGYDLDPTYVDLARRRVATEGGVDGSAETVREDGPRAAKLAESVLTEAGFTITKRDRRVPRTGVVVDLVAEDALGAPWHFLVAGPFTTHRGGMARTDVVWRTLGQAHALRGGGPAGVPLVVLTTELPRRPGEGDAALRAAGPDACFDVVDLLADDDRARLVRYAKGDGTDEPQPGFWTAADLARPPPAGSGLGYPLGP